MRDLDRVTNLPAAWLCVTLVLLFVGGAILVDWWIARKYDRWIDELDLRYPYQRSHLEESEAAAIAHLHQQHQASNDQQPVA